MVLTELSNISAFDLYSKFSETSYGEILSKEIRFKSFKPEAVTNEEWCRILGADVNNLKHMHISLGLVRFFIRHSNFFGSPKLTKEDELKLELAAICHDWQESIFGDIPQPLKTEETEKEEKRELLKLSRKLCIEWKCEHLIELFEEVINDIVFNKESELGKVFQSIEQIGYFRTALLAWQASKKEVQNLELKDKLVEFASIIVKNHLPVLESFKPIYPAVGNFLGMNKKHIDEVLAYCALEG